MILTIALNPAIDRRYIINGFEKGKAFKATDVHYTPGGKGLDVTKIIRSFNEPIMTTGFSGGTSGSYIGEMLDSMNIDHKFVSIKGETRSCLTIVSGDGNQTEILERGPSTSNEEVLEFYELYREIIKDVEIICASGSLPQGTPADIYKDLILMAKEQDKKFILDVSDQALEFGIEAAPFLIKPNRDELENFMGYLITSEEDITRSAKYIIENGVKIVVVTLGKAGSMAFYDGYSYRVKVPNIKAVNSVGSGDAMTAGFAVSLFRNYDFEFMLKVAAACGTANAMEAETGKVDMHTMKMIMNEIGIEKKKIY